MHCRCVIFHARCVSAWSARFLSSTAGREQPCVDVIESQDCEAVVPGIMEFMTTRPYITDWNEKNLGMGGNKTLYA